MSSRIATIEKFSGKRGEYQAWRTKLLDRVFNGCSLHAHGLLGYYLQLMEYIARATIAGEPAPQPFAPQESAGEMPAAGAQFPAWKHVSDRWDKESVDRINLRIIFLDSLPENCTREWEEVGYGMTRRSESWMLARMDAKYGAVTAADLQANLALLSVPFPDNGEMNAEDYIIQHHIKPHQFASTNGGPIAESTKVMLLTQAITPCGVFKEVLTHFIFTHPSAATQTFEVLSDLVRTFDEARDAKQKSGGTGYINELASDRATIQALHKKVADLEATIQTLAANAATQQPSPNTTSTHPSGGRAKPSYCWTHGPNNSHNSRDCNNQRHGHQATATASNKMGGALSYTRYNK